MTALATAIEMVTVGGRPVVARVADEQATFQPRLMSLKVASPQPQTMFMFETLTKGSKLKGSDKLLQPKALNIPCQA